MSIGFILINSTGSLGLGAVTATISLSPLSGSRKAFDERKLYQSLLLNYTCKTLENLNLNVMTVKIKNVLLLSLVSYYISLYNNLYIRYITLLLWTFKPHLNFLLFV